MEQLTGEYPVTLDVKYRISLPASLRKILGETKLHLTKGTSNCLWLYTPAGWNELKDTIMKNTNPFSKKFLSLRRQIIGPSQEVEIDSAGRIHVAASLREYAGLEKDCIVSAQIDRIEIWSVNRYNEYNENNIDEYEAALEEISDILQSQKGIDD